MIDPKAVLHRYLQHGRDAVVWKLEGASEYDVRRPLTPTATNLLGLVRHLTAVEAGYFGATFGRPHDEPMPWDDPEAGPVDDLWVSADESREDVVARYRRVWAHADATIAALALDDRGRVAHWPEERATVTLHQILVHVATETHRHAGHADILRETVDGAAGLSPGNDNMPTEDDGGPSRDDPATWWSDHRARVERAARDAAERRR